MKCVKCGKTKPKDLFYAYRISTCKECVITGGHGDKPEKIINHFSKILLRLPFKNVRKWQEVLLTGAKDFNNAA